ncbi:unnamed protein product [Rhizophagus irregularis]|nr:unnamed protein product [Rhizophagus irregularis]
MPVKTTNWNLNNKVLPDETGSWFRVGFRRTEKGELRFRQKTFFFFDIMARPTEERDQDATVYINNLDERCTEALIWELMLLAGPSMFTYQKIV